MKRLENELLDKTREIAQLRQEAKEKALQAIQSQEILRNELDLEKEKN